MDRYLEKIAKNSSKQNYRLHLNFIRNLNGHDATNTVKVKKP